MAASRALRSREIISQLVGDIGKLSNALDAEETSFTRSTGNEMNKTSEEEIMRVFGRSNDRRGYVNSASTATTSSAGILTAVPQLRATQPLKLGSEQESSGPLYSMRRNFSNQRIYGRGRNKNSKVKGSKASASGPFSRDLILLSGPNVRDVPRQGSKVDLQENGHIISAFNFRKEWSEIDVEVEIKNAFQGTLPDDVDFEILLSVHTTLSKPTLAPGQYLTGAVLSRVFKDNKPVYIRPSRELLDNTMPKKKKMALIDLESEEETKEDDDMDDYSLLPPALLTERGNLYQPSQIGQSIAIETSRSVLTPTTASHTVHTMNSETGDSTAKDLLQTTQVEAGKTTTGQTNFTVQATQEYGDESSFRKTDDILVGQAHLYCNEDLLREDNWCTMEAPPLELLDDPAGEDQMVKEVVIHRNNVLRDMIEAFSDEKAVTSSLEVAFIDERGKFEDGRGTGVAREALSLFWKEFFCSLAIGASEKVPAIRHDFQKSEWKSIARILVTGFEKMGYFPTPLSRAFVASCLYPEEMLPLPWLIESFHMYISTEESESLKRALSDDCDDPSTDEEILDLLSAYKCFRRVDKSTIVTIVEELAHQELIQKPKYVADAWHPIVKSLMSHKEFKDLQSLEDLYKTKVPTPRKICKLFVAHPVSDSERECFDHLKRYVKSLNGNLLCAFLQFVTGSNVISVDKIEVSFTAESSATVGPIAHTCGPLLTIPSSYQSYNELSEQFTNILCLASAWAFSIV